MSDTNGADRPTPEQSGQQWAPPAPPATPTPQWAPPPTPQHQWMAPPSPGPVRQSHKARNIIGGVVVLLVVLGIIGAISGGGKPSTTATTKVTNTSTTASAASTSSSAAATTTAPVQTAAPTSTPPSSTGDSVAVQVANWYTNKIKVVLDPLEATLARISTDAASLDVSALTIDCMTLKTNTETGLETLATNPAPDATLGADLAKAMASYGHAATFCSSADYTAMTDAISTGNDYVGAASSRIKVLAGQ